MSRRARRAAPPALRASATFVGVAFLQLACFRPATLDAAGVQAERIQVLGGLFAAVCAAVYALVLAALVVALWRSRGRDSRDPAAERRARRVVAVALGLTLLVLLGLLGASVRTGRALATGLPPHPLVVRVTAHQWWWDVRYPGASPDQEVRTANEIHLPVARSVRLELATKDVIHSLWLPRLHGKRDLVPGQANQLLLHVDRPGAYAGQCAEFCGVQHAHMRLLVVAEEPAAFDAWLAAQRGAARAPETAQQQAGQQVFLARSCAMCHTVRGTPAGGLVGPDLTHLASRRMIAANVLPNAIGALAGWILDPQGQKPGAKMPATALPPSELHALLAYLQSLE